MAGRQVFFSFHFDNDVFGTQQVRNIGALESAKPLSPNEWEVAGKRNGGTKKWIDDNMKCKSCVIVLVGSETATRPWVQYEITKAWNDGKGLVGIHIHNLRDPRTSNLPPLYGKCIKGSNPFSLFTLHNGFKLSDIVKCYDPNPTDPYNIISQNIEACVEEAITIKKSYPSS